MDKNSLSKVGMLLLAALAAMQSPAFSQQEIKKPDGSIFMEEVQSNRPDAQPPADQMKHPVDLSDMGVSTDPQGRIVPLIQPGEGPVMPLHSDLSVYNEAPGWPYVPVFPYGGAYLSPYAYRYGYGPYRPYYLPYAPLPYSSPWSVPGSYAPYAVPGASVGFRRGAYNFSSTGNGFLAPFSRWSYQSAGWLGR